MLLSFQVSNHKSIRGEQTLHLQPVYDKTRPALPVAAIFGANAAGKSNVLDALHFMVDAVRNSFTGWGHGVPRKPFRLGPNLADADSVFSVDLLLDGVHWTYGFSVDSRSVREEWLYSYPMQRRRVVFERTGSAINVGSTSGLDSGFIKKISASLPATSLFLSFAGRGIAPELVPIYQWFDAMVTIFEANGTNLGEPEFVERLENTANRPRLIGLVVAADVGVVDVEVEELLSKHLIEEEWERVRRYAHLNMLKLEATEKGDHVRAAALGEEAAAAYEESVQEFTGGREKRLRFRHGTDRMPLTLDDQSQGTRVWLHYLGPVLDTLDSGGLLVVDEIDTSLHPHLTTQLVGLFRDPDTNPNHAQLIFTTHDVSLLGKYFNDRILARDEVWFAEKNLQQETTLYSLAEFKPRDEDSVQRRYLTGAYGAIPQPDDHGFDDAVHGRPA